MTHMNPNRLRSPGKSRTNTPAKLLQGALGWRVGSFKNEWTLKLLRSGCKSQLPRGFVAGNRPVFVGRQ